MPFTCSGCRAKCLYIPIPVGFRRLCVDCAKSAREEKAQDNQEKLTMGVNLRQLQERLFPSVPRAAMLPDICVMVRMSILGAADSMPTEELEEILAMLEGRLELWEVQPGGLESQIIDHAINTIIRATCDMIYGELNTRKSKPESTDLTDKVSV